MVTNRAEALTKGTYICTFRNETGTGIGTMLGMAHSDGWAVPEWPAHAEGYRSTDKHLYGIKVERESNYDSATGRNSCH